MEEHYLEYLMGTLDPVTHHRLEKHLRTHPEAQASVELLRHALAPLAEDAANAEPPPGLALSALARVAEYRCALPPAPVVPPSHSAVPVRRWLFRGDWIAAACLLLLVGGMALPAVAQQRRYAHRVACADNLRRFHEGFNAYADHNGGEFPRVEASGPRSFAGVFVPLLTDMGLTQDVRVDCPAQPRQVRPRYSMSELAALALEDPSLFDAVTKGVAGHYAYCLGYQEQGQLVGLRQTSDGQLPILADCARAGGEQSGNHPGGQNVLFVGGHVRWCTRPTVGVGNDHIYVNEEHRIQAGLHRSDTVLGSSGTRPFVAE